MKYNKHSQDDINNARKLFEDGKNKCEIARITNIPRGTIKTWILNPDYIHDSRRSHVPILNPNDYLNNPEIRKAYSYILAIYLSDGYISISKSHRTHKLRLYNDSRYVLDTEEWRQKLQILFPNNTVSVSKYKHSNCFIITLYSKQIPYLFPHIGKGKKHERKLVFQDWQKAIITEYPELFIRGCIQSDGCIYQQRIGMNYTYKRYCYSNKSEDIIDLLLYCLSLKGIKKSKYLNKAKNAFIVQNFNNSSTLILQKIINIKN